MSLKDKIIEKLQKGEPLNKSEEGFARQLLLDNINYMEKELKKLRKQQDKLSGTERDEVNRKIEKLESEIVRLKKMLDEMGPIDVKEKASPLGAGFSNRVWW